MPKKKSKSTDANEPMQHMQHIIAGLEMVFEDHFYNHHKKVLLPAEPPEMLLMHLRGLRKRRGAGKMTKEDYVRLIYREIYRYHRP